MSEIESYDIIIIGSGPGGLTAGIYAMRAAMKTLIIERGAPGGQMNLSDSVENWPGEINIGGGGLSEKMRAHAESYGIEFVYEEVTEVEPGLDFHRVRLADGRMFRSHAVILATGGTPRQLGIPGESENFGRGVSYCAVCDGFFFKNKTVVVVGGGDSAVEESLYLSKIAKKVYLVHRRDELRAGAILQKRIFSDCGTEILWNTVVEEIKADQAGVCAVELKDTQTGETRTLETDGVFIFIGFDPNNALVPAGTKMNNDGYVTTDYTCSTSIPGIYAIGDLREKYARQILTAAADGCTAALAAAHYVEAKLAGDDTCALPGTGPTAGQAGQVS